MNHLTPRLHRRWALAVGLAALLLILIASGGGQPVQAALYWASANGVTPSPLTDGIQSKTPTVCFVGNAVDVRLPRVTQIINYMQRFEQAGNILFMSLAGHRLADELGPSGNVQNLKCSAPIILRGGNHLYSGDIRIVLPGTSVDATTPVPGVGCATDKLFSDPDCEWDAGLNRITCAARGYDDAVWVKTWYGDAAPPYWADFASIGGTVTSGPTIAARAANRLDAVARGQDNGLWYNYWNGSSWSGWSAVPNTAPYVAADPDCTAVASNWLECSVTWNDSTIRQVSYYNNVWSVSANLGAPTGLTPLGGPTAASWSSTRLDVVVRGSDNAAWQRSWNQGSGWSAWTSLGGVFTSDIDCTTWGANRLDCAGRGQDNQLWLNNWNGSSWNGWGSIGAGATSLGGPSLSHRASGVLDVFMQGSDGALWFRNYTDPSWNGWANLGQNSGWGSWSNPPWTRDNPEARACLYNLKLGDDGAWCPVNGQFWPCASNPTLTPYLDHTLHEVGHALGLGHEHQRNDTDPTCTAAGYGGTITAGKLTPYDRDSVMNYQFLSCGINGNYGNAGLSYYDKLGLYMMYPPDNLPAEFIGKTMIQTGQTLSLTAAWKAWGANMGFVAKNYAWRIDGTTYSTTADLSTNALAAGTHTLSFEYDDFLNRHHSTNGFVWVLSPANYNVEMGVIAAQNAALTPPLYLIDLPAVSR